MSNHIPRIPDPYNEPVKSFSPGSPERAALKQALDRQMSSVKDIPLIINGKPVRTDHPIDLVCPHDHSHVLGRYYHATDEHVKAAIAAAMEAKSKWEKLPWQDRAAIFLKAADLISQKYTHDLNAATMLGQSKNVFQAEIEATCELADFLRFNAYFMEQIYTDQPRNENGIWNRVEYRPLEGFVFALTPFNFTAIAGNLCAAPALMGNTVVWKPASSAVLSNYYLMEIFKEAGLPDGVINFIPGQGSRIGKTLLADENLGGIHFTGSTRVFQTLWQKTGEHIKTYRSYPRIVGETGGKDYIFVHPSAQMDAVVTAAIRGAFEYQGQKCSACSRIYVPRSMWDEFESRMKETMGRIKTGSVLDFKNFVNAVIDEAAFEKITGFISRAQESESARIISGGTSDRSKGYFISPTLIQAMDHQYETMTEEIFGPVLTAFVYEDEQIDDTLDVVDRTSGYALTGAIFATDRYAIETMVDRLTHSAGNFYINDKPTGAVVGQQPFGGARASGTNDKAGSYMNLLRWVSARAIKENFVPPGDFAYPFMAE